MGVFRTYVVGIWCVLIGAGGAAALPRAAIEQVQIFATCAGQLSAVMEFQWMFDGPAFEQTKHLPNRVDTLLDAVLPRAISGELPEPKALDWRIRAKAAQSSLLQQATFGTDPRRARLAQCAAQLYLAECKNLLLSDVAAAGSGPTRL